ncbi:LEA type 2 family protein [Thiohalorhabdus methylotrophus]|uniref:LEA type 2 family protein n=1 Tax=Thiohalorhabdus methylotrophus TaxID=3242694 RepID=A0ABV4TSW9_9GAMM
MSGAERKPADGPCRTVRGLGWGFRSAACCLAAASLFGLAAGCTSVKLLNADPPRVSVVSLKAAELSLIEQRFIVAVRVRNPNGFALPIAGLDYQLALNGEEFASGATDRGMEVPAFGERVVPVPITSTLLTSFNRIQRWRRNSPEMLEYRLSGQVRLAGSSAVLPFERSGAVDLNGKGGAEPGAQTLPAWRRALSPILAGE